jgi:four helix bundle protein
MEGIRTYRDLIIWQKAHGFTLAVFQLTSQLPREERFELTSQHRRAVLSVPANIVEGFKRKGVKDKNNFSSIALGSLEEALYFLLLAHDLGYLSNKTYEDIIHKGEEVRKLLTKWRTYAPK